MLGACKAPQVANININVTDPLFHYIQLVFSDFLLFTQHVFVFFSFDKQNSSVSGNQEIIMRNEYIAVFVRITLRPSVRRIYSYCDTIVTNPRSP